MQWRVVGTDEWQPAHTRDIGVGGAFLLAVNLPVGTLIECELPAGSRSLRLTAVVRRTVGAGIGVQFQDVDIDVLLELNAILADHADPNG